MYDSAFPRHAASGATHNLLLAQARRVDRAYAIAWLAHAVDLALTLAQLSKAASRHVFSSQVSH